MKYTPTHEWIDADNEFGHVGISSFAQKELGEIVYAELPKVGQSLKAGEAAAVLESTKAASDIYAPVSGSVVEVNSELVEDPGLINLSPLDKGWLFKIKLSDPEELGRLLEEEAYFKQIGTT
jgi:glycine cleavage system H protein